MGGGAGYALLRRSKKKREERERAELDALRTVVDEDITAYAEELDRIAFSPSGPGVTDEMRGDYTHALDAYDKAKEQLAAATRPQDVQPVTETLADGRFALATLEARRGGRLLPERRLPCFFDPRHGPSVADVQWAGGYFGGAGGVLGGLLVGTVLGSLISAPADFAEGASGFDGLPGGGEFSGSDFNPSDFAGSFDGGDFGGDSGGGFGGGDW
ncbi:hypothetical protein [Streptomyces sp. NPDC050485]|uniref:hypothetical protein n=1 Tax=Streptomyces sp. NPDC050485 TaxID=3365617 RepID=UPI0037A9B785